MGCRSAQTAAPNRAISNPKPEVNTQRLTTRPGCSQRTARLERLIKSVCRICPRPTQLGRRDLRLTRSAGPRTGKVGARGAADLDSTLRSLRQGMVRRSGTGAKMVLLRVLERPQP